MFLTSLLLVFIAGTTSAQSNAVQDSRPFDVKKAMRLHANLKEAFVTLKTKHDAIPKEPSIARNHGFLRHLDESMGDHEESSWDEGGACVAELASVKSQLDACQETADTPSLMFVQMANDCTLSQATTEDGGKKYTLSTADMDDETYSFSDRPFEIAGNMTTVQFFNEFDSNFSPESGGKPNAAITFRHQDTNELEGPLIAAQVEAVYTEDDGIFMYELNQSESQATVVALEHFFVAGDGVVKFEDCSIFIDNVNADHCKVYCGAYWDNGVAGVVTISKGSKCWYCTCNGSGGVVPTPAPTPAPTSKSATPAPTKCF